MFQFYVTLLYLATAYAGSKQAVSKNTKHAHVVPTYFRRQDKDGNLINKDGPDYGREINHPIIEKISSYDLQHSVLTVRPSFLKSGERVTVSWSGIAKPNAKDWIALLCPPNDNIKRHLDHFFVDVTSTWNLGYGSHSVRLYNLRDDCEFRYFRNYGKSTLTARSNKVSFQFGVNAPLQGRLALTGNPAEMRVMWTSSLSKRIVVKYGVSKSKLDMEATGKSWTYKASDMCGPVANTTGFREPGYIHDILLTKLKPMTRYFYSYGTTEAMSPVMNFTTAFPSGSKKPFKFIVYGDMGLTLPSAFETAAWMLEEYRKNDIQFIFHNGDISYARGHAYLWDLWHLYIEPYSTLIPYMVGIGNHEQDHVSGGEKDPSGASGLGFHPYWGNYGDDSGGECGVPMFNRFHMPDNGNHLWWYSYDYGMVHMIMMSTEHDFRPGSRQYEWLENDLQSVNRAKTPWVLIGGHRAMYASADISSDLRVSFGMQLAFEDLLFKYRVDMAFWAHYHSYERTCKVYRQECRDDGVIHIVVGTAGMTRDKDDHLKMPWSVYAENDYGYGRVTVSNASALLYEWVRNVDGEVRDKVWLHK
eukprot:gene5456-632_t